MIALCARVLQKFQKPRSHFIFKLLPYNFLDKISKTLKFLKNSLRRKKRNMRDINKSEQKALAEECEKIPLAINDKYYLINSHWLFR